MEGCCMHAHSNLMTRHMLKICPVCNPFQEDIVIEKYNSEETVCCNIQSLWMCSTAHHTRTCLTRGQRSTEQFPALQGTECQLSQWNCLNDYDHDYAVNMFLCYESNISMMFIRIVMQLTVLRSRHTPPTLKGLHLYNDMGNEGRGGRIGTPASR